jgi:hypothetical protein
MGITHSIQSNSSSETDIPVNTEQVAVITDQPIHNDTNKVTRSTDQLRSYNRAYQLGIEKAKRVVPYYITQARLHGKSEFIKTLYASCITPCIPPVHHSAKLDTQWMHRILIGIQQEFPDCQMDVISSGQEYITIRFRIWNWQNYFLCLFWTYPYSTGEYFTVSSKSA